MNRWNWVPATGCPKCWQCSSIMLSSVAAKPLSLLVRPFIFEVAVHRKKGHGGSTDRVCMPQQATGPQQARQITWSNALTSLLQGQMWRANQNTKKQIISTQNFSSKLFYAYRYLFRSHPTSDIGFTNAINITMMI